MSIYFRTRLAYAALIALTIAAGLACRYAPLGLSPFWVKYGSSGLWAVMVYFGLRFLAPKARISTTLALALAIAALTEFSRLLHLPWLDAFRLTTAGILTVGRVFAWANLVAYAAGIALAAALDRWRMRRG